MLRVFATRASNRLERSRQWSAFTRADHVEINDDREGSLRGSDFGQVRLCHVALGSHRVIQERVSPAETPPALKFFFQEEGSAHVRQGGRVIDIRAGQWCAMRKDLPYVLDSDGF